VDAAGPDNGRSVSSSDHAGLLRLVRHTRTLNCLVRTVRGRWRREARWRGATAGLR
jgi:hypothetical protein